MLLLTAIMVGVSWFTAPMADWLHRPILWFGVCFFSLGFIAIPYQHFKRNSVIVIGPEGIEDRRGRMGLFFWHEIREIRVLTIESQKFLMLRIDNIEQHAQALSRWSQRMRRLTYRVAPGVGVARNEHCLYFGGLTPGFNEAVAFLQGMGKRIEGA